MVGWQRPLAVRGLVALLRSSRSPHGLNHLAAFWAVSSYNASILYPLANPTAAKEPAEAPAILVPVVKPSRLLWQ